MATWMARCSGPKVTYTMLTDPEAVFRSLKSELGLRPVYRHKTTRAPTATSFISVLAYHLVHTLRLQLKAQGIHRSWDSLRDRFDAQELVTVVLPNHDTTIYHIRKATRRTPPVDPLQCPGAPPPAG